MADQTLLKFIETHWTGMSQTARTKRSGEFLKITFKDYRAHSIINRQWDSDSRIFIVNSGWGCLYRDLPNGDRQVIDTPVKGDIVGLRASQASNHVTFAAISDLSLIEIPMPSLEQAVEQHPGLGRLFILAVTRQNAILAEHLVNVGRRNSTMRTAHFLLEMEERLAAYGLSANRGYECPLTQQELADVLGLTTIHVNRTLSSLRTNGLATFKNGFVELHDRKQLVKLSGFDREYLRQG
jgi:CRP-like cAMP-binding protein